MIFSKQRLVSWSNFRLASTEVHVWHASLEQPPEVVRKLEAVLSEEEVQRAERFHYPAHRQAFIVSRGILRNLLYRYTDIKPEQIQFQYNQAGKPFIAGEGNVQDLQFNVSHAGPLALYAFSWGCQVGIDVECIHPMEEMDQVAEMNFAPSEYKHYRRLSQMDRLRAFYNCWTRKEAFIKAIGDGFCFPVKEFEVSLAPDDPATLLSVYGIMDQAMNWSLYDLKTWDGYAAALVVEGKDYSVSHKQWTYT